MDMEFRSRTVELVVKTAARIHDSAHQDWAGSWLTGCNRSGIAARTEANRLSFEASSSLLEPPTAQRAAAASWAAGAAEAWALGNRDRAVRLARRGFWAILAVGLAEEARPAWSELFGV